MMGIAWSLLGSPALRLIDSETAHSISMRVMRGFGETSAGQNMLNALYRPPEVPIEVFGKMFHHPLGLAAGFDKGAEALMAWSAMGFSWTEYGGVTRYPQDGNTKPRMFRANRHKALVNKMGGLRRSQMNMQQTIMLLHLIFYGIMPTCSYSISLHPILQALEIFKVKSTYLRF